MNGAESLLRSLVASGVDTCFANPGTSEMHFVAALDRAEGMRAVLGLFEGVVTGMADGYGRMRGAPAVTLLHLGPGLANGLANLHNARRADTPIVNVVGDHATYHARYDAPLASDIAGFAAPVSSWIESSSGAEVVGHDAARAVQAARRPPGAIATLILPADVAWNEAGSDAVAPPLPVPAPTRVDDRIVSAVVDMLRNGKRTALLVRGDALGERGLAAASRVANATGARILCDTFTARLRRGAGVAPVERLPYFAEQLVESIADVEQLVLVGAKSPVAFFAYPGKPSDCVDPRTEVVRLAEAHHDCVAALEAVAEAFDATPTFVELALPDEPTGRLDQWSIGKVIARHLPENAIVSDEGATNSLGSNTALLTALPHDVLSLTGGSIGQGVPVGAGAAVACPDRKVVCLQGDGGGMYTLQTLWTMAREDLDTTVVVFANRAYSILQIELNRTGARDLLVEGDRTALSMFDLTNPSLDWVKLAEGMGVEAVSVGSLEAFSAAFRSAMGQRGPRLIEIVL